jgi:hypothetical protein
MLTTTTTVTGQARRAGFVVQDARTLLFYASQVHVNHTTDKAFEAELFEVQAHAQAFAGSLPGDRRHAARVCALYLEPVICQV